MGSKRHSQHASSSDELRRDPITSGRWTIAELGERVSKALAVDYAGQPNGQISAVPNRRTIRYYTTLGLLDRPVEMRGRTAFYDLRHLRQLVAIKRLQATGRSLAEIQQLMPGLTVQQLNELANLPNQTAIDREQSASPSTSALDSRRRDAFWAEAAPPAPAPPPAPTSAGTIAETFGRTDTGRPLASEVLQERRTDAFEPGLTSGEQPELQSTRAITPELLTAIELGAGVRLSFRSGRQLTADDLKVLAEAAAPLLKILETRDLVRSR